MTLDEGKDDRDGSEINAVRRRALELIDRSEDDLTDVELMRRMPDRFNFITFCLERLQRLPSEVQISAREWTEIRAWAIVTQAQHEMIRLFSDPRGAS